eukprot:g16692.t1
MMWTHHDDGDQSPGAPPDAKPEATAEGKPEATAEAMAEATTEAAVETSAEATAPAPEPPALSLTPKPVPVSQAIPQGFRSLAVPDVGETASARDRIPAVPRLILPDPPMCLTRMPLAQSAQLPPQLDACGFELDVLAPQLGSGAYAAVRKLRHRKTGREMALKIVEKQPLEIRQMLPQMQRELGIQGALRHKHLLRLMSKLGIVEDDRYIYMLLEFCGGGTLRSLCQAQPAKRLAEPDAARLIFQILQGVDHMHSHGFVHRDLKADNILLSLPEFDVRICDFGWSAEATLDKLLLTTIFDCLNMAAGCGRWVRKVPPEIPRHLRLSMNAFENSSRVTSDGALVVRSSSPLFGEFATRSRIPFNLVNEEEVSFQVSYTPPSGDCPFRCSCHARCFGPASCSHEGQPTGGPWAEVTVDFPNQKGLRLPAAAQVFANHVTWAELCGKRVVHVPKNDVSSVDLKGGIAILAEKFKPGTTSDGAILREAYQAGAVAVIKIGGGGAMLYSVPDPTEIPCFAISEADGKVLCDALANTAPGLLPKVREMKLLDQREALHSERWGAGKVWVMLSGLYLQSVDWENPLSEVAEEANASKGALIYEDYFEVYESSRSVDPRLSLEKSKLRTVGTVLGHF